MGNALNSVIYQPPKPPTYTREDLGTQLRFVRSGHDELAVLVRKSETDAALTTPPILVFYSHGNAEDLGGIDALLAELSNDLKTLGLANVCVAYDYSGYGQSQGKPSESTVFRNASDVLREMMEEFNIPAHRVVLWGRSLGSGPTCYLAHEAMHTRKKPVAAVVLLSPLLSVFRVGLNSTSYYRWPTDQFCNYERVRDGFGENTKIFVIHGTVDTVVPFAHGKAICECIPERNLHPPLFVKNAGHNDVEYRLYAFGADGKGRNGSGMRDLNEYVAKFIQKVFADS